MATHQVRRIQRIRVANDGKLPPFPVKATRQPKRSHFTGRDSAESSRVWATSGTFDRAHANRRRALAQASKRRNR